MKKYTEDLLSGGSKIPKTTISEPPLCFLYRRLCYREKLISGSPKEICKNKRNFAQPEKMEVIFNKKIVLSGCAHNRHKFYK